MLKKEERETKIIQRAYSISLLSLSSIVMVVTPAVGLGSSPDGGFAGILRDPWNSSSSSSITSSIIVIGTSALLSSGLRVINILVPL